MSPNRFSQLPGQSRLPATRPLHLFGSLWSLRQHPSRAREWSWAKKLTKLQAAGFDGVFSPPIPALRERGDLRYLAVASFGVGHEVEPVLAEAKKLGAVAIDIQLCDYDTAPEAAVAVVLKIRAAAKNHELPFAVELHRDTITETPEKSLALWMAYRAATGEDLPCCIDHSHFAVVRHLAPPFWERLREPESLLQAATQFHLRPFNGHHCQIPVLNHSGRRTPEYRDWLNYAKELFAYLQAQPGAAPVLVVPEIGNAAPAYRLSTFPDTWCDVVAVAADLRALWKH